VAQLFSLGSSEAMAHHEKTFRLLASSLALGGVLWGIFIAGLIFESRSVLALLFYVPGYLVTAGYIARCFSAPRHFWLRMIWGISAIVQGGWLIWYFSQIAAIGVPDNLLELINIMSVWWVFAFVVSVFGYFYDKERAA
jgi:hypothetical protein